MGIFDLFKKKKDKLEFDGGIIMSNKKSDKNQ